MKCIAHNEAHYVCINKNCYHRNSYLCQDPNDICKEDHEGCSLVSWRFVLKKVRSLKPPNMYTSQVLIPLLQDLKNITITVEDMLKQDTKLLSMQQLIETEHLSSEQKSKIVQFMNEKLTEVPEKDFTKLQIQMENVKSKLLYYLDLLKPLRKKSIKKRTEDDELLKTSKVIKLEKIPQKLPENVSQKFTQIAINSKISPNKQKLRDSNIQKQKYKQHKQHKQHKQQKFDQKISTILKNHISKGPLYSKITNDVQTLYSMFFQKSFKGTLLYRASQNDFLVSKFHEKCDGHRNTLTILLTEHQKIIGGFTPLPWKSGGGEWYEDAQLKSFLFSLSSGQRYPLLTKQKAIWCSSAYGPSFGNPDLEVSDRAIQNSNSCANFPHCYNNGNYVLHPQSTHVFCGSSTGHFRIREWEVYQLQFPE